MFTPSADTKIIVPVGPGEGPVVNDRYFGKVPADRLVVREDDHFLVMTADGKYRSKIGVPPSHARKALGSYSPSLGVLTVVTFSDLKPRGYVNSLWEDQKDPLSGRRGGTRTTTGRRSPANLRSAASTSSRRAHPRSRSRRRRPRVTIRRRITSSATATRSSRSRSSCSVCRWQRSSPRDRLTTWWCSRCSRSKR